MRTLLILVSLYFSQASLAGVALVAKPLCGSITNVRIYRCVCRMEVLTSDGRGQISMPLTMANGQTTIFSGRDLTGTSCDGNISPTCNPTVMGSQMARGAFACALGETRGDNGETFEIR